MSLNAAERADGADAQATPSSSRTALESLESETVDAGAQLIGGAFGRLLTGHFGSEK